MNEAEQMAKLGARILENLPGMPTFVIQSWIKNPESLQRVLKAAMFPPGYFSHLAEVTVGYRTDPELSFSEALKARQIGFAPFHADTFNKAEYSQALAHIRLCRVSVKDLDLKDGASAWEIVDRALLYGLTLCPHDVVLRLMPGLKLSTIGRDHLHIAMESIAGERGERYMFRIEAYGDYSSDGKPDLNLINVKNCKWNSKDEWIFVDQ